MAIFQVRAAARALADAASPCYMRVSTVVEGLLQVLSSVRVNCLKIHSNDCQSINRGVTG